MRCITFWRISLVSSSHCPPTACDIPIHSHYLFSTINVLSILSGYTVYHEPSHPYVYATLTAQGLLGPTEHHVGQVDPETLGIPKGLKPTSHLCPGGHVCTGELPHDGDERLLKQHGEAKQNRRKLLTGTLKNLVIPIVFSDHEVSRNTLCLEVRCFTQVPLPSTFSNTRIISI